MLIGNGVLRVGWPIPNPSCLPLYALHPLKLEDLGIMGRTGPRAAWVAPRPLGFVQRLPMRRLNISPLVLAEGEPSVAAPLALEMPSPTLGGYDRR